MSVAHEGEGGGGARWALVLGVSSGTGAAIAREVASAPGLDLFGVHRNHHPEGAAEVARAVAEAGRRVHLRVGEGGTAEAAAEGAEELLAVAGPRSVGLFVHSIANASVGRLTTAPTREAVRPSQIQKTFDSMAHSFVYWTQELVARDLLAPRAQLLGLSNPFDDVVLRDTAVIAATKATLAVYVRHLAHELGPRGHRVNLLKFGFVATPAVEKTFGSELERMKRVVTRALPAGRLCTVEEVARFVAFLAGDEAAAWFNGATIDFTGGEAQALYDALVHPAADDDSHRS